MSEPHRPPAETSPSLITRSTIEGTPQFSAEQSRHELKAAGEAHKRQLERLRLEDELKDSEARRHREWVGFCVVIGVACLSLALAGVVAVFSADDATRRWAQGLVALILGGIVGGLAGYFTGKVGK